MLLIVIIKVPKLLFSFPPLDDAAEACDCKEDLDVPIPPMPIWMVDPNGADILYPLYDGFDEFWLGHKMGDGHLGEIRGNGDDLVEGGHEGVDRVIYEDAR